jgi:hypothetical protein
MDTVAWLRAGMPTDAAAAAGTAAAGSLRLPLMYDMFRFAREHNLYLGGARTAVAMYQALLDGVMLCGPFPDSVAACRRLCVRRSPADNLATLVRQRDAALVSLHCNPRLMRVCCACCAWCGCCGLIVWWLWLRLLPAAPLLQ